MITYYGNALDVRNSQYYRLSIPAETELEMASKKPRFENWLAKHCMSTLPTRWAWNYDKVTAYMNAFHMILLAAKFKFKEVQSSRWINANKAPGSDLITGIFGIPTKSYKNRTYKRDISFLI